MVKKEDHQKKAHNMPKEDAKPECCMPDHNRICVPIVGIIILVMGIVGVLYDLELIGTTKISLWPWGFVVLGAWLIYEKAKHLCC
ncbi:MAG: hypothetical protein V1859_09745 [archaeon]